MPSKRLIGCCLYLTMMSALSLVVPAAHALQVAPESPDRPWVIPAQPAMTRLPGDDNFAAQSPGNPSIEHDRQYDLAALIDLAQRTNPETREAWEQARQAALAVGLVESTYAPQLSVQVIGGFQRTPLPIPTTLMPRGYFISDTRELIPTLAVKWLLFDFGKRAGQKEAARANSFVANVAFTGVHQKLIFDVTRAYFALSAAKGRLRAAQQAVDTAKVVQDATTAKRRNGVATVVATAQSDYQVAQAKVSLAKANGDARSAYTNLMAIMGLPAGTTLGVATDSDQMLPPTPVETVDAYVKQALSNRPDVIAALGKIHVAEGQIKSARAAYYPTISVEAQLYQNVGSLSTNGSPYYNINRPGGAIFFALNLPLFDGGARASRVSIARSQEAEAQSKLDQVRDTATQQVVQAYDDLQTTQEQYAAAVVLQKTAHVSYDAALQAFKQGVGTYTDLASGQTALAQADAALEDAHASVYTASAALALATGAIRSNP
ncbi:MAG TPA: TolC family protein [Dyella sp.]